MMQIRKVLPLLVGVFLLTQTVPTASALSCFVCGTRDHDGCTNLDFQIMTQECTKGQVCVKFISSPGFHRAKTRGSSDSADSNYHTVGVIRSCETYHSYLGPLNDCSFTADGERCLCNTTDFCNNAHRLSFNLHAIFFLVSCLLTVYLLY